MARTYTRKTDLDLAYENGKRRLRAEAQAALAILMNGALAEYTAQFNKAVAAGNLPRVTFAPEEVRGLLFDAAKRELAPPVEAEASELMDLGGPGVTNAYD